MLTLTVGRNGEDYYTIQEAIDAFEDNRKLLAVIVTSSGRVGDEIVNLLTSADLPMLLRLLEE